MAWNYKKKCTHTAADTYSHTQKHTRARASETNEPIHVNVYEEINRNFMLFLRKYDFFCNVNSIEWLQLEEDEEKKNYILKERNWRKKDITGIEEMSSIYHNWSKENAFDESPWYVARSSAQRTLCVFFGKLWRRYTKELRYAIFVVINVIIVVVKETI